MGDKGVIEWRGLRMRSDFDYLLKDPRQADRGLRFLKKSDGAYTIPGKQGRC